MFKVKLRRWGRSKLNGGSDQKLNTFFGIWGQNYPSEYSLSMSRSRFRFQVKLRRWGRFMFNRWSDQKMNTFFGIWGRNYPSGHSLSISSSSFRSKVKLRRWGRFMFNRCSDQKITTFFKSGAEITLVGIVLACPVQVLCSRSNCVGGVRSCSTCGQIQK